MLAEPHIAYSEQVRVNPLLYEFQMTCPTTPAYTVTFKCSEVLPGLELPELSVGPFGMTTSIACAFFSLQYMGMKEASGQDFPT